MAPEVSLAAEFHLVARVHLDLQRLAEAALEPYSEQPINKYLSTAFDRHEGGWRFHVHYRKHGLNLRLTFGETTDRIGMSLLPGSGALQRFHTSQGMDMATDLAEAISTYKAEESDRQLSTGPSWIDAGETA